MSSALMAYNRLSEELAKYIAAGKGDSGQALDVLGDMEGPWNQMSLLDRAIARLHTTAVLESIDERRVS